MTGSSTLTHGTCVALGQNAALLLGPPGSGKSDLALRFIMMAPDRAGRSCALIADDQVLLEATGGRLIARPPSTIAGLMEVRGVGVVDVPFRAEAELRLAVRLCEPDDVPRLPDEPLPTEEFAGVPLPVLELAPFESSAPWKLLLALQRIAR